VDATLITDLIQQAFDEAYDRAILISGDADFVPAVTFIQSRMKQVTHVGFRSFGHEIRNACWDHLFFEDLMGQLLA